MITSEDARFIKRSARSLGFDLVSFTNVEVPEDDKRFFLEWCRAGFAGGMEWLAREPARRAHPTALLAEALGLVTLGVSYFQGAVPPAPPRAGRVARYAWGEDYHDVIGRRVRLFEEVLKRRWGADLKFRSALDAQPLLERAFARRAGLGFIGKNTNLIAPRLGSWIFLTEILVDLELPTDDAIPPKCGGCTACQSACPTDALREPFRLDARRCIAYHTIENRGWIPAEFRPRMGRWLFGCDECQDVCPFNARAKETAWPELTSERGVGPWVPLEEVLRLRTDEAFKARFRGTPLLRAKRRGLVRNACVAAGNAAEAEPLYPALRECLENDPEPVVRGHAAWAIGRQITPATRWALDAARKRETDAQALKEIEESLCAA